MPGAGKKSKSSTKKKAPTRRDQTDGTGDKEYEEAALRYCSRDQCFNHKDLKECGRCKCVSYCSVECQRMSWKQHKPLCKYNTAQFGLVDEEPLLQRHLRHWTARFDATLHNACIRGLNLKYEWERIDQGGLMLFMEPRPHPNVGSRWRIVKAGVFPNEVIMDLLEKAGFADEYRDQILPLHNIERERLRQSSGGTADHAQVILMAANAGPDALAVDVPPTIRFKPVDIYQSTVARMPMEKYAGDWSQDLKDQVLNDHPMKHGGPAEI
ncbi:hypothetical protein DFH09DRAFT_1181805 [Mycena vulgaris]|nr:hypothetical protein DFH09DRAFT_1181805 [Mycena vulgaris]